MFLLVLDKNAFRAAEAIPDRLKFKQLLELGQLVCSAGISSVFKPIKQGKELQEWVKKHPDWTYMFYDRLFEWVLRNVNVKDETIGKFCRIKTDLHQKAKEYCGKSNSSRTYPDFAIFRYIKEYKPYTVYETNKELPIDIAVEEYSEYIRWKEFKRRENKVTCS